MLACVDACKCDRTAFYDRLVPEGPCCAFYTTKSQVYCVLIQYGFVLVLWSLGLMYWHAPVNTY